MNKIFDDLTRIGIAIDFDNLLAHCEFLKNGLSKEKIRFEEYVERETASLDEESKYHFFDIHSEEHCKINDIFPSLQANSALLLSYGLFEKNLNDICQTFNSDSENEITLKDLQGQGIERAKTYLSKICKIKEPFSKPDWEVISKHSQLRNIIAHTSGQLDLSNPKHKVTFDYFKNRSGIKVKSFDSFQSHAEIEVTLDFVIMAVQLYRKFLIDICNQKIG